MEHRTIEIDFDVHKRIEAERSSFAESANEVLRRLLGVGVKASEPSVVPAGGRAWMGKGVSLPSGTQVRMRYRGQAFSGVVRDGKWVVDGHEFSSPSAAASTLCRTKTGTRPQLDGWKYWEAMRPGDDRWSAISTLRPEYARVLADIHDIKL